jgi:hypothetical protein
VTVHRLPASGSTPASLTLGDLHRALRGGAGDHGAAVVSLHFEQRSSVRAGDGAEPLFVAVRRFDAELDCVERTVVAARLQSGGAAAPVARIDLRLGAGASLYSIDGERFGTLDVRPRLFDLWRFERRLDGVPVVDAAVEAVDGAGEPRTVLDCDLTPGSFLALLALFRGGQGDDDGAAGMRSFSVALEAADGVALDYWWSLADAEPGEDMKLDHAAACHVTVRISPLASPRPLPEVAVSVEMPALRHLDDVWALTRRS